LFLLKSEREILAMSIFRPARCEQGYYLNAMSAIVSHELYDSSLSPADRKIPALVAGMKELFCVRLDLLDNLETATLGKYL
jgi:hypothetical protein